MRADEDTLGARLSLTLDIKVGPGSLRTALVKRGVMSERTAAETFRAPKRRGYADCAGQIERDTYKRTNDLRIKERA